MTGVTAKPERGDKRSNGRLEAPLTIYVDEAGSPDFTDVAAGERLKAYVPCAVAVPRLSAPGMNAHLPRAPSGKLLKSSDLGLSEELVLQFLKHLLASKCEIAAILIDPGGDKSIRTAQSGAALATERRQAVHHGKISASALGYSLLVAQAVINVIKAILDRTGNLPSFVDVVLDEASISRRHKRGFEKAIRQAGQPRIHFGRLEWVHEQQEPLLLLPDLVAGVLHRHGTVGDLAAPCRVILDAAKAGRVSLQDGHKLKSSRSDDKPGAGETAAPP